MLIYWSKGIIEVTRYRLAKHFMTHFLRSSWFRGREEIRYIIHGRSVPVDTYYIGIYKPAWPSLTTYKLIFSIPFYLYIYVNGKTDDGGGAERCIVMDGEKRKIKSSGCEDRGKVPGGRGRSRSRSRIAMRCNTYYSIAYSIALRRR